MSSTDPDAKIAKMKDGTTHLAYKAEHFVDLDSGMILGADITSPDTPVTQSLENCLHSAQTHLEASGSQSEIRDVAADKGYHATNTLSELNQHTSYRTYIPEPKLPGGRNWSKCTQQEFKAVQANRRSAKGNKGRELQRMRSEKVERTFADCTGDRWSSSKSIAWNREGPETLLPDDGGLQFRSCDAHIVRNWYFQELARDGGGDSCPFDGL